MPRGYEPTAMVSVTVLVREEMAETVFDAPLVT
jgi:hypothetical protein